MTVTTPDIILIIGAIALAAVNIITALKVKNIEHSVNSAAERSLARIEALLKEVAELKAAVPQRRRGKPLAP